MDISNRLPTENLNAAGDISDTAASNRSCAWPLLPGTRLVFLLDARDKFEADILQRHAREQIDASGVNTSQADAAAVEVVFIRLATRQTGARLDTELLALEQTGDSTGADVWLQPMRVVWLPGPRRGKGLIQDLFHGRVTQPGLLRRRWLARHRAERLRCVCGEGAYLDALRARYEQRGADIEGGRADHSLREFVRDQAMLALERAERHARGARYKIARLLPHEVFADQRFQRLMARIANGSGMAPERVLRRAERYLREMAASQTPFTLELLTTLYRTGVKSNHDPNIDVRDGQLQALAQLMSGRPVVFLISHKSIVDTVAFSLALFDANLPVPMTFGGINLGTVGIGSFARRAGIIFLRRAFQDNEIYKGTFRRYIDYLIEKRFSIIWALEGTRSRTGKLLPPRYGLLNYVVESVLRTGIHNLAFVPVSVAYDQITEVEDYAIEQRGKSKKAEGMGWMLRYFKRGRSHGRIFVRFGKEVSLPQLTSDDQLTPELSDGARTELVQTLAFQMALRMNQATPVTATAILTLILLASGVRSQNLQEIKALARSIAILVRQRKVEIVGRADFRNDAALLATLGQLHDTGIVSYYDEGIERLYNIRPEQHHKAAYYRNTAIHHFIVDALVEIALLQAASDPGADAQQKFFSTAYALRDLFKFEFYFARRLPFREHVIQAADKRFTNWSIHLHAGPQAVHDMMRVVRPLVAHGVLRSFVDAYRIGASTLSRAGQNAAEKKADFLSDALKLGRQQLQQALLSSPESVSKTLYETAHKVAAHRDLLAADRLPERRAWETQLVQISATLDQILAFAMDDSQG